MLEVTDVVVAVLAMRVSPVSADRSISTSPQPRKVYCPRKVTVSGRSIDVSEMQPSKQ